MTMTELKFHDAALALTEESPANALIFFTSHFVALAVAMAEEHEGEVPREIRIDGGIMRDITIHPSKGGDKP